MFFFTSFLTTKFPKKIKKNCVANTVYGEGFKSIKTVWLKNSVCLLLTKLFNPLNRIKVTNGKWRNFQERTLKNCEVSLPINHQKKSKKISENFSF